MNVISCLLLLVIPFQCITEVLVTLSPNTLPLLFREYLHGFCADFSILVMALVCVCSSQPPDLLINLPCKFRVGE